jgi:hypothetical protein
MGKKNSKVNSSQRAAGQQAGRFALLPARDEVITSERVRFLLETSELASSQQQDQAAETIRSLREGRIALDADLSDLIGNGRD